MMTKERLAEFRATLSEPDRKAFDVVRKLFRNDKGEPFELTQGQIGLFRAIYEKQHPRVQFECYTQYGKSDTVSMAVALRAGTFAEKWVVLGGTKDKAEIIMKKVIKHTLENEYLMAKFQIGKDESIERIKREQSKERITFKVDDSGNIGEVMVLSADARRKGDDAGDILIGHGSPNLIEDDAALIPDNIHAKAIRMLGGFPEDNFLLKITNTFGRNHAYRSSVNPKFAVHRIDWRQGIAEGRLTQEFVDECRENMDKVMFGVLYDCTYPPSDMVDEAGWMTLITHDAVEAAQNRALGITPTGRKRMGGDCAETTNFNVAVLRQDNFARIHSKWHDKDLMATADRFKDIIRDERVLPNLASVDAIGVGAGIASRLKQMELDINAVRVGDPPTEKTDGTDGNQFANLRAELYWRLKLWVEQGGALEPSKDWSQLCAIRYRINQSGKIQIMPKEQMRMSGLIGQSESTDVPDALSLTFFEAKSRFVRNMASGDAKPYYPELGL